MTTRDQRDKMRHLREEEYFLMQNLRVMRELVRKLQKEGVLPGHAGKEFRQKSLQKLR